MSDGLRDQQLRREILAMLLFDKAFLVRCGDRIEASDFGTKGVTAVVAQAALDFWQKHRIPLDGSAGPALAKAARSAGMGRKGLKQLRARVRMLRRSYRPERSEAVSEQVAGFKDTAIRGAAISRLARLHRDGELTGDIWLRVMTDALQEFDAQPTVDWIAGAELRGVRRTARQRQLAPWTLIEPLDRLVKPIGAGHLGMLIAPYKAGKSLGLIHLTAACVFQGWNALFVTLEDPLEDVEDRFDACVSGIAIARLEEMQDAVQERVESWALMKRRSGLRLYDGTAGDFSVATLEGVFERLCASGFVPKVVVVDYDDEIRPSRPHRDRRHEFADIYRSLRQFATRRKVLVWTAAQAKRDAETKEIVTGRDIAEDISKVRKATLAIGIGTCREWNGEAGMRGNAKTLHVAAHKFDRQRVSCRIWADPAKGQFYDHDRTALYLREQEGG